MASRTTVRVEIVGVWESCREICSTAAIFAHMWIGAGTADSHDVLVVARTESLLLRQCIEA